LAAVGLELHARLDRVDALEGFARHVLDQRFDALAIGLGRLDIDSQRITGATAFQRLLQARDDVPADVEIAQRMVVRRTVEDLAFVVGQDVVERGHAGGGDLHGVLPGSERKGGVKWMAARTGGLTVPRLVPTLAAAAGPCKPSGAPCSGRATFPFRPRGVTARACAPCLRPSPATARSSIAGNGHGTRGLPGSCRRPARA